MITNFSIHTKVTWYVDCTLSWEEAFYHSLVKKIRKSDNYFNSIFEYRISPLSQEIIDDVFFPLYEMEIERRSDYAYKSGEHKNRVQEKLGGSRPYYLFGVYVKESGKFAGGMLYSERDNSKIYVYLRTFDRQLRSQYSSTTTIDYWAEKVFFEIIHNKGSIMIVHGADNYPIIRRVGLPLFKLKVGGKPKVSKSKHNIREITEKELLCSKDNVMFFDEPDEQYSFTKAHLFYREEYIDPSVLGELLKVLEWAHISLSFYKL
jgi:hypothetical protein